MSRFGEDVQGIVGVVGDQHLIAESARIGEAVAAAHELGRGVHEG